MLFLFHVAVQTELSSINSSGTQAHSGLLICHPSGVAPILLIQDNSWSSSHPLYVLGSKEGKGYS